MTPKRRPATALVAALVISVGLMVGCVLNTPQRALVPVSMTMAVAEVHSVGIDIVTTNGKVGITQDPAAREATVSARAKLVNEDRAQRFTISTTLNADGTLVVRPVWPDGERLGNEVCSFDIIAPALSDVSAHSSNGSIHLTGGQGKARIETSNGAIRIVGREGKTYARTSNGPIKITGGAGELDLTSSNGSITILGTLPGPADAPYQWRASTSNGNIRLDLNTPATGHIRASTTNGKVSISQRDAWGEAQSLVSARSVKFDLSEGPGEIVLTTSNGAIVVVTP